MTAFGRDFSRALCLGCASLGVPLEWVLATLCLEGDGMNPYASNRSGARGMWQKMPDQVWRAGRPLILPVGESAPAGCILRTARTAGTIVGLSVWRLYAPKDPVKQVNDFFTWTRIQLMSLRAGTLKSREALYCCNLAPARLLGGEYDAETILYSANREDEPLNARGGRFVKTYWPEAWEQNAGAFGLHPVTDPQKRLRMRHLAVGLDAAVKRHRRKYDAELELAYVVNAGGGEPPPTAA